MPTLQKNVTQQDIAEYLGVSQAWVARALKGDAKVSQQARAKVLTAAQDIGYEAENHRAARGMAAKRHGQKPVTGAVGIALFPEGVETAFPYYLQLQEGVRAAAVGADLEVMLVGSTPSPGWERVDGIVAHGANLPQLLNRLPMVVPLVCLMVPRQDVTCVVADDYDGMRQATEHLLQLDHRRIGYLTDTDVVLGERDTHHTGIRQSRLRKIAYENTLRAAGVEPAPRWIGKLLFDTHSSGVPQHMLVRGRSIMNHWIDSGFGKLGLTALLVQNDRTAIGVLQVLHEKGIKVPDDLSVVGFDSTDECEQIVPRLSSVRVPLREIGARALELLQRQWSDESSKPETVTLPVHLEVRDSTSQQFWI